jgi:hypothetical protein
VLAGRCRGKPCAGGRVFLIGIQSFNAVFTMILLACLALRDVFDACVPCSCETWLIFLVLLTCPRPSMTGMKDCRCGPLLLMLFSSSSTLPQFPFLHPHWFNFTIAIKNCRCDDQFYSLHFEFTAKKGVYVPIKPIHSYPMSDMHKHHESSSCITIPPVINSLRLQPRRQRQHSREQRTRALELTADALRRRALRR